MTGPASHVAECPICAGDEGTILRVRVGEDRHFFPGREVEKIQICSHEGTDFYVHVIWASEDT